MDESERVAVDTCKRCDDLVASRSRIVNGVGPTDADLLFVGEAPGEQEDAQGEPFVGRSGAILDEVLEDAGLGRDTVRITNCVKCRPPENRDPRTEEVANCREYLDREIVAVDPEVIVTLGKVPSEHLLDRSVAVTSEAGSFDSVTVDETTFRVLVCVHPAASLYDRGQRDTLESAIQTAAELTGATGKNGQSQLGDY